MHPSVILDPTTSTTAGATPRLRSRLRLAGAALATLLLLGLAQLPAWAHDQLLSSTPADGKAVTALPPEIVLTLSEAPLATGAQVVITAADGSMIPTGTASVDEATATVDPESTSTATAQDTQEKTPRATQGLAATTNSHDDRLTSDPLLVVVGAIALAVVILVVVAYVTRRRDHSPEPADTAGPDTQE